MIDIIIPTVTGREASLARCIAAYQRFTTLPKVIRVFKDYPTCGEAWRVGAETSRARYLHLTADDLEPHPDWDRHATHAIDHQDALPCPTVLEPDGHVQSTHGVSCQAGISTSPVQFGDHVGFTTVPFLKRDWWPQIGMPNLHYCSDAWVSVKARAVLGVDTIAVPQMRFTHHNEQVARGASAGEQHAQTINDRALFTGLLEEAA